MKKSIYLLILAGVGISTSCEKKLPGYDPKDIPFFAPLAAPAAGLGYQIHLEPFPIQANFEREIYIRKSLGNTEEAYLTGFKMKARSGTHHMIAYNFLDAINLPALDAMYDQNNPNNTLNLRSFRNAAPLFQSPAASYDFNLPPGYAVKVPANTSFFMNMHYFNKTNETRFGELYLNFYTKPANQISQLLDVEYYSNKEPIDLAASSNKTMTTDFIMEKKTVIPMMLSHYHKRGKQFTVQIVGGPRDGEEIYSSQDYENPIVKTFAVPLVLQVGEGLRTIVSYINESDQVITDGITSEDEMNIMICFQYHP
jgi:hypothetical protein